MIQAVRDFVLHGKGDFDALAPSWREKPMVPSRSFRRHHGYDLGLGAMVPEAMFYSSSTLGEEPAVHRFPDLGWFRDVISVSFPEHCRGMDTLCLTRHRTFAKESACAFWGTTATELFATESCFPYKEHLDLSKAKEFIDNGMKPIFVIGPTHMVAQLLDYSDFDFPAGSIVMTTGGLKGLDGRHQGVDQFHRQLEYEWGVETCQSYGMTELTSAFYGDGDWYDEHPWTRVHTVDPVTLERQGDGNVGRICIFDLANDVPHILTDDIGIKFDDTFEILGRKR